MKTTLLPVALIIFAGLLSFTVQASTIQASPSISSPFIQIAQNNQQSLDDAAQSIKQQTGGRILSAKTVEINGQRIHKIKVLLPSGKVRVFNVNAN